ncbi:MAG: hypothetical protein HY608_02770 [Planctomycetes bacterium]|nr:hypothetical protein [Planctomycetota bacterium]
MLLEHLGSPAWNERESATEKLARMGPGVIPSLLPLLSSPDPEVVSRARSILERLGWMSPECAAEWRSLLAGLPLADVAQQREILQRLEGEDRRIWRLLADVVREELAATPPPDSPGVAESQRRRGGQRVLLAQLLQREPSPLPEEVADLYLGAAALWGDARAAARLDAIDADARTAALRRGLGSSQGAVRAEAIRRMSVAPEGGFDDVLREAVSDPDPVACAHAFQGLLRRGDAESLGMFRTRLRDAPSAARRDLLERCLDPSPSPVLWLLAEEVVRDDADPAVLEALLSRRPQAPWTSEADALVSRLAHYLDVPSPPCRTLAEESLRRHFSLPVSIGLGRPEWGTTYRGALEAWRSRGSDPATFEASLESAGFYTATIEGAVGEDGRVRAAGTTTLPDESILSVVLLRAAEREEFLLLRRVRVEGGAYETFLEPGEGATGPYRVEVRFQSERQYRSVAFDRIAADMTRSAPVGTAKVGR